MVRGDSTSMLGPPSPPNNENPASPRTITPAMEIPTIAPVFLFGGGGGAVGKALAGIDEVGGGGVTKFCTEGLGAGWPMGTPHVVQKVAPGAFG